MFTNNLNSYVQKLTGGQLSLSQESEQCQTQTDEQTEGEKCPRICGTVAQISAVYDGKELWFLIW